MSALSWPDRHALTQVLADALGDPRRAAALASTVGLALPPQRGFEPAFARLSGLVLAADRGGKVEELLDAGVAAGVSADAVQPFRTPPPPPAQVLTEAPEGSAPRPAGVPTQAPPREGATSWLARNVVWQVGEEIRIGFEAAAGEAVAGAPAGHASYAGEPFPVELELTAEGCRLPEPRQTVKLGADDDPQAVFALELGDAETIDIQLRCYSGGFEVGRGRYRLSADGEESGGALAVPNTVLEPVDEDAIKTVRTTPTE